MSIYVSIDIESIDQEPSVYNMLSVGMVAFDNTSKELSSFTVNLNPGWPAVAQDIQRSLSTHGFWARFPEAYAATRVDPVEHGTGAEKAIRWLRTLGAEKLYHIQFVAYPAGYDWTHVYPWLYPYSDGELSFGCIDIKTLSALALAVVGTDNNFDMQKSMPESWLAGLGKHNHLAVDDAREQGLLFFNILGAMGVNAA